MSNALTDKLADLNRQLTKAKNTIKEQAYLIESLQAQLKEAEKELEMLDYAEPVPLTDEPNHDILEAPPKESDSANGSADGGVYDDSVRRFPEGVEDGTSLYD